MEIVLKNVREYDLYFDGTFVIPQNVTLIGESAFNFCSAELKKVYIPKGVKKIGKNAFRGCRELTTVVLPEGLTYIEDGAFCYCESLNKIVLPEGLSWIGKDAFHDCHSLKFVKIPMFCNVHDDAFDKGCIVKRATENKKDGRGGLGD